MQILIQIILLVVSWIWWIAPFTFVFFLIAAIKESIRDGDKDITYGVLAAISLFVLVVACMSLSYN